MKLNNFKFYLILTFGLFINGTSGSAQPGTQVQGNEENHPLNINIGLDLREFHSTVKSSSHGGEIKSTVVLDKSLSLIDIRGNRSKTQESSATEIEANGNYTHFVYQKILGIKVKNDIESRKDKQMLTDQSTSGLITLIEAGLLGLIDTGEFQSDYTKNSHGLGLEVHYNPQENIAMAFSLVPSHSTETTKHRITSPEFPAGTSSVETTAKKKGTRAITELNFTWGKIFNYFTLEFNGEYAPKISQTSDYHAEIKSALTVDLGGPLNLKMEYDLDYDHEPELIKPSTNRTLSIMVAHNSGWF